MSCDDLCELWKHDVNVIEKKDMKTKESVTKQPIITVKRSTLYRQWNRWAPYECITRRVLTLIILIIKITITITITTTIIMTINISRISEVIIRIGAFWSENSAYKAIITSREVIFAFGGLVTWPSHIWHPCAAHTLAELVKSYVFPANRQNSTQPAGMKYKYLSDHWGIYLHVFIYRCSDAF